MYKTIYIRKADETFWERGEDLAKSQGISLSAMLSGMLRNRIYDVGTKQARIWTADEMVDEALDLLNRSKAARAIEEAEAS